MSRRPSTSRKLSGDCDLAAALGGRRRILIGHGCGEPLTLTEALVAQRAELGPLDVFMASAFSSTFQAEHADHIRFSSMGALGGLGRLARAGRLDIVPCHTGQIGRLIADGLVPCEAVLIQVSPAGADGSHSFGLINDHMPAAVAAADVVIAEINEKVPWTPCDRNLSGDAIHWFVESAREPVEVSPPPPTASDRAIAQHAASWIRDGCVLQMGIGGTPEAIMRLLHDRRDLGVHSGLIGDGVMELMEAGVVTNARKRAHRGVTVTGALVGSARLYRFADHNPAIRLCSAEVTHGETTLSGIESLVSLNSALEVDLTGQVNAEAADGRYVGATGGQVDFVRAGARSPGGAAIIALPATARDGAVSRIVARLSGPVTTARSEVDVVVTEFGAAELRGRSVRERVRAMVAIAHPDFREALDREAYQLMQGAG